jgi:hypothetical protein
MYPKCYLMSSIRRLNAARRAFQMTDIPSLYATKYQPIFLFITEAFPPTKIVAKCGPNAAQPQPPFFAALSRASKLRTLTHWSHARDLYMRPTIWNFWLPFVPRRIPKAWILARPAVRHGCTGHELEGNHMQARPRDTMPASSSSSRKLSLDFFI